MEADHRNRLGEIKWSPPKEAEAIDKRGVINPVQAVALLPGPPLDHK